MQQQLSEAEAEVYDRGIRLWGVGAQQRLRGSHVAVVGFGQIGAEVAKNLVLAGVGRLSLLAESSSSDREPATSANSGHLFGSAQQCCGGCGITEAAVAAVQELNPLVAVSRANQLQPLFDRCDFVCACGLSLAETARIDTECRSAGVPFASAAGFGERALIFCDVPSASDAAAATETVAAEPAPKKPRASARPLSFSEALALPSERLAQRRAPPLLHAFCALFRRANALPPLHTSADALLAELEAAQGRELAYVSAVVGGILAQEVIKALTRPASSEKPSQQALRPLRNVLCYDCRTCAAITTDLNPFDN